MNEESAAARVARGLRESIATGATAPGAVLSQAAIAAEYGVSRIPVRDALHTLGAEGLVELTGSSAVVTSLSIDDLQELYDLREAVEPRATELAVPRMGRAEVARMAEWLAVMESPGTSVAEWLEANRRFHALVYRQAGRPRTIALVEQLRRLTDRYVHFHLDVGEAGHLQDEHRQILAAVRDRDAARAAELTRVHLVSTHDVVLRHLLRQEDAAQR